MYDPTWHNTTTNLSPSNFNYVDIWYFQRSTKIWCDLSNVSYTHEKLYRKCQSKKYSSCNNKINYLHYQWHVQNVYKQLLCKKLILILNEICRNVQGNWNKGTCNYCSSSWHSRSFENWLQFHTFSGHITNDHFLNKFSETALCYVYHIVCFVN